jgi:hypothetical protein
MLDRLNSRIKPTDLFEFGLIQEFAGRLPIIAHFNPLSREMMVRIMTEPKNSIYRQYRQMLANDGVELAIEPLVFQQIADLAMEYKVGARSLRGIFEEMLTPTMYLLPDHPEVRQVKFTSLFEEPKFIGKFPQGRTALAPASRRSIAARSRSRWPTARPCPTTASRCAPAPACGHCRWPGLIWPASAACARWMTRRRSRPRWKPRRTW